MMQQSRATKLPSYFSSGMVMQQGKPVPFHGTDLPGQPLAITIQNGTEVLYAAVCQADASGLWEWMLPPLPAGGPYRITVEGSEQLCLEDVLIGDVWLCSGQSNMDMPIADWGMVHDYESILAGAGDDLIRLLDIDNRQAIHPLTHAASEGWKKCTAEHLRTFSAVAYCFAERIRKNISTPIGIIVSAVGGTRIETWIPAEALFTLPFQHIDLPWLEKLITSRNEIERQYLPTVNYNAMIAPLIRFPVKGFLWYQGEANAVDPETYLQLSELLVATWRAKWNDAALPFLFVQLANYGGEVGAWKHDDWARLREAQELLLFLPHTGMVTAADLGETNDIHPKRKREVGERLAELALNMVYGMDSQYALVRAQKIVPSEKGLILEIEHGEGLYSIVEDIPDFETVTPDGEVIPQQVILQEGRILFPHALPEQTAWVRYGWSNDPLLTVYNRNGNPLLPFRLRHHG